MQNYIKSVRDFLRADPEIVTDNIHFLRVPKDQNTRPVIIFTEIPRENPYDREGWKDVFNVLFECIVDYNDSILGRQMREILKKKLSSYHWSLTADWTGNIWHLEDVDLWYDEKNDVVRRGSIYLFKSHRDL